MDVLSQGFFIQHSFNGLAVCSFLLVGMVFSPGGCWGWRMDFLTKNGFCPHICVNLTSSFRAFVGRTPKMHKKKPPWTGASCSVCQWFRKIALEWTGIPRDFVFFRSIPSPTLQLAIWINLKCSKGTSCLTASVRETKMHPNFGITFNWTNMDKWTLWNKNI